jgi:hypothetical protein
MKGLAKILISRCNFGQVEAVLLFCQESHSKLVGTSTTIYNVAINLELSGMYIQMNTDSAGKKKFDLPLSKALEAEDVTK